MTQPARAVRALWWSYWRLMRRYHRFEVRHLERVSEAGRALIVGYHGRPMAYDLCMLQSLLRERTGRMPHAILHGTFLRTPVLQWLAEAGEFLGGDDELLRGVLGRGGQIIVTPGGTREGYRSFRTRYRVDWGERLGYLRLALKYELPIIPTAATGVDDAYIGLNDGYRLGRQLQLPGRLPLWLGLGPLGPFPFSPPYPVRITLHIGEPIVPARPVAPDDRAGLLVLHRQVMGAVQGLLDQARAQAKR